MHLLVTDRLACPRCGPRFGLILMADRLEDRRVLEGRLGCANCREHFPISAGFGDLRPPPRGALDDAPPTAEDDPEGAIRVGAFLGVTEGPGLLLLTGDAVRFASRLAAMVEGIEVVAMHAGLADAEEEPGVTRIVAGETLPFFTGALRGVVLEGEAGSPLLTEAIRVVGPGSRLVFRLPSAGTRERLEEADLPILLATESVLVAARK